MEGMLKRAFVLLFCATLASCTLKDEWADPPPDVAAPPADALRTESGIASKVLRVGLGGVHPTATSTVVVMYSGWTPDGNLIDSWTRSGSPVSFPLDQVIAGWTEGIQLMVKGEKRRFWIPGNLAYDGMPDRPQGLLVFDVELVDVR
jgi:FKBP-type peptidyl-prolyl cis-trans isomerase